ncbi:MAG: T9SS type A sorting domain-containing protein [Bacteroidota bacterium]
MMKIFTPLFTLIITFSVLPLNEILACTCGPINPPFCEEAVNYNLFMARIIEQQEAVYNASYSTYFTNVEIIDFMNTTGIPDTVSMINSDGLNCNDYIFDLAIGDTLIISIRGTEVTELYDPKDFTNYPTFNTYSLYSCGKYYLEIHDGKVGGMSENQAIIDLADFLANPQENCPQITNTVNPLAGQLEVYPNPVQEQLFINNQLEGRINGTLFDINGVAVRSLKIRSQEREQLPMDDLPAGTYLLKFSDGIYEHSRVIIRQ